LLKKKKDIVDILCDAIKKRSLIKFCYESTSTGKGWRTVEPYIVGIKDNGAGNIFIAALPIKELSKSITERELRHYLLKKLDINAFELLKEAYDEPHVERDKIVHTPTIKVICRYYYPGEKKNGK